MSDVLRWTKLGKIFDPAQHQLPADCQTFAQSPQALVFDTFVRIYFSTRARDPKNGKFLSHVAFVDMSHDFSKVLRVADKPVIALGTLGSFDEHGIFPMNVVRHGDRVLGYTCGWSRRVSVSVETGIGLAVSHDEGLSFDRIGDGPVLSADLNEPCLVGDGFVQCIDDQFYMWYIFGTGWRVFPGGTTPDRTYKIGQATSPDGVHWTRNSGHAIVPDLLGPDESQALPSVIRIGSRYHMVFCYRESFDFRTGAGRGYRLGQAWSDDLRHWTRTSGDGFPAGAQGEWDSDMQCYPHIFRIGDRVLLLYNGNEFGRHGFGAAVLQS